MITLYNKIRLNLHYELWEFLNLDISNLDGDVFCSLLMYGNTRFSFIINEIILEATIRYIRSSK